MPVCVFLDALNSDSLHRANTHSECQSAVALEWLEEAGSSKPEAEPISLDFSLGQVGLDLAERVREVVVSGMKDDSLVAGLTDRKTRTAHKSSWQLHEQKLQKLRRLVNTKF